MASGPNCKVMIFFELSKAMEAASYYCSSVNPLSIFSNSSGLTPQLRPRLEAGFRSGFVYFGKLSASSKPRQQ